VEETGKPQRCFCWRFKTPHIPLLGQFHIKAVPISTWWDTWNVIYAWKPTNAPIIYSFY
jgi:hypothetical protein